MTPLKISTAAVFLAFTLCASVVSAQEHSAQFELGCKQMQSKRFADAISTLTEAIAVAPKDSLAIFRRGQCFFCLAKYDDAIADFNRAIQTEKDVASYFVWRGTAFAKTGKDQDAIFDYLKAMRIDPQLVTAYNSAKDKGEATGAVPNANSVTSSNNANKKKTVDVGRKDKAVEDYAEAIKTASLKATAYFRPGTVFSGICEVGDDGRMLGFKLDSKSDGTITKRDGDDYFALDGNESNIRGLDDQINEHPERADLYYAKGRLLEQLGWVEMALDNFTRAVDLERDNVKYRLARAFLYHNMQKDELATGDIQHAVDLDPELPNSILFSAPKTKSE
jgi:tetratricopeptide (TPR) repeat protein